MVDASLEVRPHASQCSALGTARTMLALTESRPDDAERLIANTFAAMLLPRRAPGDIDRARTLLQSARGAYQDLRMHAGAAQCDELEYTMIP